MSRYRKIEVQMWGDEKFRALSAIQPSGQGLWLYLLTGTHTSQIPGLFRAGRAAMSEELNWSQKGFDEAFNEVFKKGMAKADFNARVVWIPNAVKHNRPESPNVVISWGKEIDLIPECELKNAAVRELREFMQVIDSESKEPEKQAYTKAFDKAFSKALKKASEKTMVNQEQEQEQEQEEEILPEAEKQLPAEIVTEPIFMTLPLNDKSEHPITESFIAEMSELFPAVDVKQAIRSMKAWLIANPKKRKTKQGINKFITNWLANNQDKGGSVPSNPIQNIDYLESFRRLVCSGGKPKNQAEKIALIRAQKAHLGRASEFEGQRAWKSYITEAYQQVGNQPLEG